VSASDDLNALAEALEGRPPAEILAAAAARHPGRVALACSFGAEDCLLVDEIAVARLPIEVFTLDTGYLFPESYALWKELEARYGVAIHAERGAAPASESAAAPAATPPWEADPDGCCEVRKVVPLRTALARLGAWVTGIRRDQTPDRAGAKVIGWDARVGLEKVNPLAAWTHDEVWAELRRRGVPVNPLHARGYSSIGCAPCTTPVKPGEDPRAGRWRGKQKTECGLHFRPVPGGPPPLHPALDHGPKPGEG
jgi:phosphoadenylyl-sulfate reductase (thioredoxin)